MPDHYIFRMLYSRGVSMESLGIPTRDGTPVENDPRKIWQRSPTTTTSFAARRPARGSTTSCTRSSACACELDGDSAQHVYDQIAERLASPEFRPRALFERFNIEVLATTDAASDSLEHHRAHARRRAGAAA